MHPFIIAALALGALYLYSKGKGSGTPTGGVLPITGATNVIPNPPTQNTVTPAPNVLPPALNPPSGIVLIGNHTDGAVYQLKADGLYYAQINGVTGWQVMCQLIGIPQSQGGSWPQYVSWVTWTNNPPYPIIEAGLAATVGTNNPSDAAQQNALNSAAQASAEPQPIIIGSQPVTVPDGLSGTITVQAPVGQNPVTGAIGPIPPHMKVGATLLSDSDILNMSMSIGFSASDRTRFIAETQPLLSTEQVSTPALGQQCTSGGQYQGTPAALTALKGGGIALGATASLAKLQVLTLTEAASATIAWATFGIGVAVTILTIIAQHHAAAVANEQGLECKLIPPGNHCLQVIENAVVGGYITPQQGQSILQQLLVDFKTYARDGSAGQLNEGPGSCNALCWFYHMFQAIVIKKQNRYSQYA